MLQTVRTYFEQYMYNNKHEFEELCKNATNKDDLEKEYISDNGEKGNYNETIKAENKIISSEALRNILVHMDKKLKKYKAIGKVEEEYNQHLGYGEKEFTFEDSNSSFKFDVDFYDVKIVVNLDSVR